MPNIIEKYVEVNNGFIIFISGPIAKKVKKAAKHIATKFKFSYINSLQFTSKHKLLFSEHDILMDWDTLNKEIKTKSNNGVVVSGYNFPKDKIINSTYHIHLSISKSAYIAYRNNKLNVNKLNTNIDKIFIDRFYQYVKTTDNMLINKFIKIDTLTSKEIYEKIFDLIISFVNFKLYK